MVFLYFLCQSLTSKLLLKTFLSFYGLMISLLIIMRRFGSAFAEMSANPVALSRKGRQVSEFLVKPKVNFCQVQKCQKSRLLVNIKVSVKNKS